MKKLALTLIVLLGLPLAARAAGVSPAGAYSGIGKCTSGQVVTGLNASAPPTCGTGGGTGTVTSVTGAAPITSTGGATPQIGITLPLTGNAVTLSGDANGASNATQVTGQHISASANTFLAGPVSGAPATSSFRNANPVDIDGMTVPLTNDSGTGTTANSLAKYGTSANTAVVTSTSDTKGALGVAIAGAGTSGTVYIQNTGIASCNFDATAVVYQDYVQISSSAAGKCHDAGAAYPASGQVIGQVNQTGGAGNAAYDVNLSLFNVATSPGGSGTVNTGTGPQLAQYQVGTSTVVGPVTLSGAATIAQGGAVSLAQPYSATSYTNHGTIIGQGSSNLAATATGTTGAYFRAAGASADPLWSTLILPNAATQGDLLTATSANTVGSLAAGAADTLLQGQGASTVPAYVAINNCATELTYSTSTHTFGCAIPVTSLAGTANQIAVSGSTGAVTLSLIGPYTPATYTAHAPLVGEGTSSISASPGVGSTGTFLYGQSAADPIWSTLTLPNAATKGDILTATATNAVGSVADVAVNQVLTSGGVGNVPAYSASPTLTSLTTTGDITDGALTSGNCVQATTGGKLMTIAGACSAGGSGTVTASPQGQLAYYSSAGTVALVSGTGANTAHALPLLQGTSAPTLLPTGGTGTFLYGQGGSADPIWSTLTLPNAATTGDILFANASNAIGRLADVAVGSVLESGGTSTAPSYVAINSSATTISGSVTGTAVCKQSSFTLTVTCVLSNYNSTPQSYTYPTAFTTLASMNDVQMGLGAQALLTTLLLPQGGPVTGVITVVGS